MWSNSILQGRLDPLVEWRKCDLGIKDLTWPNLFPKTFFNPAPTSPPIRRPRATAAEDLQLLSHSRHLRNVNTVNTAAAEIQRLIRFRSSWSNRVYTDRFNPIHHITSQFQNLILELQIDIVEAFFISPDGIPADLSPQIDTG